MTFFIKFILVALAMAVCDWAWTKYMLAAGNKQAMRAANWSTSIIAISAFSVVSYVNDYRLVAAAMLGAWIGTFYAVKHETLK